MRTIVSLPELVRAAKAGEETAWNALYRQYYPKLYAVALRLYSNGPAAKDAVQETFIIAYLKLFQLKEIATFGGWLKKILLHHSYRDLHRNRLNVRLDTLVPESDAWWEDELSNQMESLWTKSQLYTALARLPEILRSTVLLRYYSDFSSYEQIAAILGVPVGTVRSRLNQAKVKLIQYWEILSEPSLHVFHESEEWNEFYKIAYSRLHIHDSYKNEFIHHLHKDVQIITGAHESIIGNWFFDRKISEDRQAGSWLKPDHIVSCGEISIIETSHYNSPEHPFHCPAQSVTVLYRQEGKVSKMHLYISTQ